MKIAENTPDRLVFEARPVVMSALLALGTLVMFVLTLVLFATKDRDSWVFAVGFAIFAAALAAVARRTELVFDRAACEARLFQKSLFGSKLRTIPLNEIVSVTAPQDAGAGGRKGIKTYTLHLELVGQPALPLTRHGKSGEEPARMAEAMNAWLKLRQAPDCFVHAENVRSPEA